MEKERGGDKGKLEERCARGHKIVAKSLRLDKLWEMTADRSYIEEERGDGGGLERKGERGVCEMEWSIITAIKSVSGSDTRSCPDWLSVSVL